MGSCATTLIIIATILGPITLVFMSVSFGTDHWLEFKVNTAGFSASVKDRIKKETKFARYHLTRYRGIFRECYPGNDTEFLDKSDGVVDGYCFNIDYDQPSNEENPNDDYMSRLHLNRSFLAFFVVAIFLFLVAYIFGLILCCMRVSKWAYVAGMLSYVSAFFLASAIAFFHGAEYIERNKLLGDENSIYAQFYQSWLPYLKMATTRNYGWSYALGWVGMILATIAATFYSVAGCYISSERYEEEEYLHKKRLHYPVAMEPVYTMRQDPYYTHYYGQPRAYIGPFAPDYYSRNASAVGYADPSSDIWHWKEVDS